MTFIFLSPPLTIVKPHILTIESHCLQPLTISHSEPLDFIANLMLLNNKVILTSQWSQVVRNERGCNLQVTYSLVNDYSSTPLRNLTLLVNANVCKVRKSWRQYKGNWTNLICINDWLIFINNDNKVGAENVCNNDIGIMDVNKFHRINFILDILYE